MSIQGMNQTIKFNRQQKVERKTMYDRKETTSRDTYGPTDDHTQMKSHEFANFQKEQFIKRKQQRKRDRQLWALALLGTLIIVLLFLIIWNNYDFNVLKSSEFQ